MKLKVIALLLWAKMLGNECRVLAMRRELLMLGFESVQRKVRYGLFRVERLSRPRKRRKMMRQLDKLAHSIRMGELSS